MKCKTCGKHATVILSVGSLGRTENLCDDHLRVETYPLDASLIPYQLTGLDASPTSAQALSHDLAEAEAENEVLRDELAKRRLRDDAIDARAEHERLTAELEKFGGTQDPEQL